LEVFRTIPSEGFCEELQRFFNQIREEPNALSAMDFFFVTKKMFLALIGSLMTYELVLLQFDGSAVDWDHLVDCEKVFMKL
jgi:gustatory receptor